MVYYIAAVCVKCGSKEMIGRQCAISRFLWSAWRKVPQRDFFALTHSAFLFSGSFVSRRRSLSLVISLLLWVKSQVTNCASRSLTGWTLASFCCWAHRVLFCGTRSLRCIRTRCCWGFFSLRREFMVPRCVYLRIWRAQSRLWRFQGSFWWLLRNALQCFCDYCLFKVIWSIHFCL